MSDWQPTSAWPTPRTAPPGTGTGWGPPSTPQPSRGPQGQPPRGGSGLARSALLVGAVVGLVVGAVGFFALAPADGSTAAADGSGGGSGATVTTSPGAGGTEGEGAAEGQAATPEEQAIYDLAEAVTNEDCAAIIEQTDIGYWGPLLGNASDEAEGLSACEAGFASGELGPVRVYQTSILRTTETGGTWVAATAQGWNENTFVMRQHDGVWRIYGASFDPSVVEDGAAETEAEGEGSASGGGAVDQPSSRPVTDPEDPPSGNTTYDELAQNCHDGSMVACDDLYWVAPRGSDYELYGITCGGRRLGTFAGGHCERDFNRQLSD
jgi:hypothetical protein